MMLIPLLTLTAAVLPRHRSLTGSRAAAEIHGLLPSAIRHICSAVLTQARNSSRSVMPQHALDLGAWTRASAELGSTSFPKAVDTEVCRITVCGMRARLRMRTSEPRDRASWTHTASVHQADIDFGAWSSRRGNPHAYPPFGASLDPMIYTAVARP